jgi:DNA-binding NtrC family response regulator
LSRYDWPGNVRQLENAVFRAVVLADGPMLTPAEFPQIAAHVDGDTDDDAGTRALPQMDAVDISLAAEPPFDAGDYLPALDPDGNVRPLAEVEAAMIRLALDRYDGRMTQIARRLGIGRSTLYRKLKELGISDTVAGIAAQ